MTIKQTIMAATAMVMISVPAIAADGSVHAAGSATVSTTPSPNAPTPGHSAMSPSGHSGIGANPVTATTSGIDQSGVGTQSSTSGAIAGNNAVTPTPAQVNFGEFDKDSDGSLNASEYTSLSAAVNNKAAFKDVDADRNGSISTTEYSDYATRNP